LALSAGFGALGTFLITYGTWRGLKARGGA
jgi:hypothetical protein